MDRTFFLLVSIFLISCQSNKERLNERISDDWSIEEFYYLNENHMDSLGYNVISFNFPNQGDVYIPSSYGYEGHRSIFEIIDEEGELKVDIYSKNKVFDGIYNVKWARQDGGIEQLQLVSEKINIKAYNRDW